MFLFSWKARNGETILTREPEIIIVTYIYVSWAPRHICCDVYVRPVGFKGLTFLLPLVVIGTAVSRLNILFKAALQLHHKSIHTQIHRCIYIDAHT